MKRTAMPLTLEQLILAGVKSYENADDLLRDAELLFANERWARTLYLCCIADEELAKAALSMAAAAKIRLGEFDTPQEQAYRKRFHNHRDKTGTLHAVEDFFWSDRTVAEILESLSTADPDIDDKERIKLSALYTDFDGDGVFCPGDFFTARNKVEFLIRLTRRRVQLFRDNVRPLFDVVATCDIERCRMWITNLNGIV